MPINYEYLGRNDKTRKRRYDVLEYHVKNVSPDAIAKKLNVKRKTVYNDLVALGKILEVSIPLKIIKGTQSVALELKIKELESLVQFTMVKDPTTNKVLQIDVGEYTKLQTLVLKNRELLLKLMGLMSDKIDLSGTVDVNENKTINVDIDEKLAKEFGDWLATRKQPEDSE